MTHSDLSGLARFLTLADVATELSISVHQAYALVRSGELPAIKIGGHWRVETAALEGFIADKYEESRRHAMWQQAQFADVAELFGDR
jgi:excisionase family DNA binding protein